MSKKFVIVMNNFDVGEEKMLEDSLKQTELIPLEWIVKVYDCKCSNHSLSVACVVFDDPLRGEKCRTQKFYNCFPSEECMHRYIFNIMRKGDTE